jgi:hypothetical protein
MATHAVEEIGECLEVFVDVVYGTDRTVAVGARLKLDVRDVA